MSSELPSRRLSVAVFIYDYSTSGVRYSGGRYHALLLSYAIAHGDIDVTVVSDSQSAFVADLEKTYGADSVTFVASPEYDHRAIVGRFDYVFIAPTGGFNPAFYACAESVAGRSGATLVLINYESANWFNSLAPTPDDLAVWDYWRRIVVRGGVVLSSTHESDSYARSYYQADRQPLEFAQCYPPLNSQTVEQVPVEIGKDGALLSFVRLFHDHKGGADLLALPSSVFENRVLRLIVGGRVDPAFCSQLSAKLQRCGGRLEVHSQVSELEKFSLLARSNLLLFPSRFEGFGYPPLEAALVGTDSVCYDLPVLRETLGEYGRFAPMGDLRAFGQEIHRAIASPSPPAALREQARRVAGFGVVSRAICAQLRAWRAAPTHPHANGYEIHWGPWTADELSEERTTCVHDEAPMPSYGTVREVRPDDLTVEVVFWHRSPIASVALLRGNVPVASGPAVVNPQDDHWIRVEVELRLQRRHLGHRLRILASKPTGDAILLNQQFVIFGADDRHRLA